MWYGASSVPYLLQVGGGFHHERPAAHQQGLQVEHLHRPAVPPLPQVNSPLHFYPEQVLQLCLKVPKREIFDRSDFPDFHTIKSLREGDCGVKI